MLSVEACPGVVAAAIQKVSDRVAIGVDFIHRLRPGVGGVRSQVRCEAPAYTRLERIVIAGRAEFGVVDASVTGVGPDGVIGEIDAAENRRTRSGGRIERQLAQIAIVLQMASLIA